MGNDFKERRGRLRQAAQLGNAQALLVTHLPDIRWATGFTGSNGCLLVSSSGSVLITDGRYREQVGQECTGLEAHIFSGPIEQAAASIIKERSLEWVFLQKSRVTWGAADRLRAALDGSTHVDARDPMAQLRAVKSEIEIRAIRDALSLTERVFEDVLSLLKEGVSEQDIASEIDYRHRQLGASGPAFDTIVAFSDHAALPHARPGKRTLKKGDVVLMDFGCVVDGYHSDMTRTVTFGRSDKLFLEAYEAVRTSLLLAQDKAHAGLTGEQLDGIARQSLSEHGFGSTFTHSLGHGAGLEIHEAPSVSSRNTERLPSGCIITIEPGVYLPGEFGIRIENMAHIEDDGCDVLNRTNTDLIRL